MLNMVLIFPPGLPASEQKFCLANWNELAVFPRYKDIKEHYIIEKLIPGLGINDKIPGRKDTFKNYYLRKYGLELENTGEPLLRISSAMRRPDMLKPSSVRGKQERKHDLEADCLLLPQLMGVEPVTSGLWIYVLIAS